MDAQERELPEEYKKRIKDAIEGNLVEIRRQIEENTKALKAKLDASYQAIKARNDKEMARWEKAVGPVPEFQGVITRF